ncbi:MAG: FGGY family carbohydrate kinase [Planctomycetota bacterium]|jgi:sugar (pentulose or hexulose) kinase
MVFCGIDIGTTNTKAVLLDRDGTLLGSLTVTEKFDIGTREKTKILWYEYFSRVLDDFSAKGHFANQKVVCSVTAQGGTFVLVNNNFEPTSRAFSWTESASKDTARDLAEHFGNQYYYHTTGWQPNEWLMACKLRELTANGLISKDTRSIATVPDFVYSKVTGEVSCDITNAQITGLCDFKKAEWDAEILEWTGVEQKLLPVIVKKLKVLFEDVKSPWGKISLATSSHDQYAVMRAAALRKDESIMLGTGTAWVINGKSSNAIYNDKTFLIHPGKDLSDDGFGFIIVLGQIGAAFDKLLNKFDIDKKHLAEIESKFKVYGLPSNPVEVNLEEGVVESESEVDIAVKRYMEWSAAAVSFMLEKLKLKKKLDRIVMTGGAVKSGFWPQVIANLSNIPVEAVDFPEFTAYGAALQARAAALGDDSRNSSYKLYKSRIYEPQQTKEYQQWYNCHQKTLLGKIFLEL